MSKLDKYKRYLHLLQILGVVFDYTIQMYGKNSEKLKKVVDKGEWIW